MKRIQWSAISGRFSALSPSDQRAVLALAAFLLLCLLYLATRWSFDYRQRHIEALEANRELVSLLNANEKRIKVARYSTQKAEGADQPLLTLLSATAKESRITFKRFQPDGDNTVKLWMERIEFNNLLFWLHRLQRRNGVSIQEISVEQTKEAGFVDVRLTLQR